MEDINTDSFYYSQKVKIEIEIEPFKLFLATTVLMEFLNDGDFIKKSITETGRSQLHEIAELLIDKCGDAQQKLRQERGN